LAVVTDRPNQQLQQTAGHESFLGFIARRWPGRQVSLVVWRRRIVADRKITAVTNSAATPYASFQPEVRPMVRLAEQLIIISVIAVTTACLPVHAQSIIITNASFESPVTPSTTFSGSMSTAPPGWAVYNLGATNNLRQFGVLNPTGTLFFPGGVPHGSNVGVVFLQNTTSIAEAGLQQTLSSTLQLNTTYTLQVAVGNIARDPRPPFNAFNFNGFPGYRIDLLAGTTVIASDLNLLAPAEGAFLTSTLNATIGDVRQFAGQPLGIRLVNLNGSGIEVNFDDVRLQATPVPEPTGLLLIAIATVGAAARLRWPSRTRSASDIKEVLD